MYPATQAAAQRRHHQPRRHPQIPNRYRHLEKPTIRYARWDLSAVELIDARTLATLCPLYPLDKSANADGQRRTLESSEQQASLPSDDPLLQEDQGPEELPPLLRKYLADYAATGQPPAYLPIASSETTE